MSITGIGDQPAGILNRQVFAASGTWLKPTGASAVRVQVLSGGNGGGSGRRGATSSTRTGGAGGAGGVYIEQWFNAGFLPSGVAVTVGTGGAGGASIGADNTNGNPGATGGQSSFGTILVGPPALGFAGGGSTGSASPASPSGWSRPIDALNLIQGPGGIAGTSSWVMAFGGASDSSTATPNEWDPAHNNGHQYQPVGGGGGACATNSAGGTTGGAGLQNLALNDTNTQTAQPPVSGFTGAAPVPVASPKQLTDTLYAFIPYYSGAGGSATGGVGAGTGGAGGSAQGYGAGGGGGAASANGFPSGTGGAGAPGLVIVTSY